MKNSQIEEPFIPMCLNPGNYVVQANDLIGGKQNLNLNEAKLVRMAIMQVVKEDTDFKPYILSIKELGHILNIDDSNLYRDVRDICRGIGKKPAEVQSKDGSYRIIPWIEYCDYPAKTGMIHIKLNEALKPYLINLSEYYTQYYLENILAMKSVYAIRIFELIQREIMVKVIPKEGIQVDLSINRIKEACVCEDKYNQFGSFRQKVIDVACKEIERVTLYTISYDYIKQSRTVVGLLFTINMKYH